MAELTPKHKKTEKTPVVAKCPGHVLLALKGVYFLLVLMDMWGSEGCFTHQRTQHYLFVIVLCQRMQEEFGNGRWVIQAFHLMKGHKFIIKVRTNFGRFLLI